MTFPKDVRGVYETSEREVVDPKSGRTVKRKLVAKVMVGEVLIRAGTNPPEGDVAVELEGKDPSKDYLNRKTGERASVYISGSKNFGNSSVGRPDYLKFEPTRFKVQMDDRTEQIQFTFSATLPAFANDESIKWKFTKTGTMPSGSGWSTPSPGKPVVIPIKEDPVDPFRQLDLSGNESDSSDDGGTSNAQLIVIAVIMMLAAALSVRVT